ncbi:aminotransferase class V-fold PLP-dependent enzyme, partial [candidate division KSB1 bacterium]|nr:aminotransferase class V-fold PLP-dependent enzyme [candidate division KSB1 bacterium]
GFNLLASGLPLKAGDEVVFSSLNHAGAGQCWFHYAKEKGFSVKKFEFPIQEVPNLSRDDIVDIYARNISEKTRVVVFPHIDNLVGIRYPVKELAEMARKKGVQYIAVDGAQAVGMVDVNLQEMGIDFYAASPHKWLQAPKGTGLLYIRKELQPHLKPMWVTWGQERWKGSVRIFEDYGTRNLAATLTLGNAVDFQSKLNSKGAEQRRKELRDTFYQALKNNSKFIWRSPLDPDLATSLYTVELKETSSRALFKEMFEKHGYVFRPFESENWNAIRLSLNIFNTFEEIDRFNKLAG